MDDLQVIRSVACPWCFAPIRQRCWANVPARAGRFRCSPHGSRRQSAEAQLMIAENYVIFVKQVEDRRLTPSEEAARRASV